MKNNIRNKLIRSTLRLLFAHQRPIAETRAFTDRMSSLGAKIPADVSIENININGLSAAWISNKTAADTPVILYLHGGGYVSGSLLSHRMICVPLAQTTQCRILLPDYRLAPENPFPAALEDALSAYHWLIKQGLSAADIFIVGDSAGGGLALATALSLREAGEALPAGLICISPWADLTLSGSSHQSNAKNEPVLTFGGLSDWARAYTEPDNFKNPLVSPIFASLENFPPLLIQVGSEEVLLDDSKKLKDIALQAGVSVTLSIWEDMWHVWHASGPFLPEVQAAFDEINLFIERLKTNS